MDAAVIAQVAAECGVAFAPELRRDPAGLIEQAEAGDLALALARLLAAIDALVFDDLLLLDLLLEGIADRRVRRATGTGEDAG